MRAPASGRIPTLLTSVHHADVGGTRAGIVGVYQTYAYADEKRAALEAWGRHIDFILTGEPAKVVQLPKRGA